MLVYKCDRCGKYFDNHQYNVAVLPKDTGPSRWDKIMLKHDVITKEFDACPDCLSKFVEWLSESN